MAKSHLEYALAQLLRSPFVRFSTSFAQLEIEWPQLQSAQHTIWHSVPYHQAVAELQGAALFATAAHCAAGADRLTMDAWLGTSS